VGILTVLPGPALVQAQTPFQDHKPNKEMDLKKDHMKLQALIEKGINDLLTVGVRESVSKAV